MNRRILRSRAGDPAFGGSAPCRPGFATASPNLAREGRFDYLPVEATEVLEPPPAAETHVGRRTALTFPLVPPLQKNRSPPSNSSPDTLTPAGIASLSRTSPV